MGYEENDVKRHRETEFTVRWVIFWLAAVIITIVGLVANHEYEKMVRDCPVIVEEMP